jgi:hypothetical protein
MAEATCEAIPLPSLEVAEGRRVYRSGHFVAAIDETGSYILYNIEGILLDSLGHRATGSALNAVSLGPVAVQFLITLGRT